MAEQTILTLRINQTLVDNLDRLVPHLAEIPEYNLEGNLTRSDVVRLVLWHGLQSLEAELRERDDPDEQIDVFDDPQETLLGSENADKSNESGE